MSARAPYCPDTLSVIRSSAENQVPARTLAAQLGWDVDELMRIAKRHGYAIAPPEPVQREVFPVYRSAPENARVVLRASMRLDEIIEVLPDRTAAVLRVLADMGDHAIKGETIAEMLDMSLSNVVQAITALRRRLYPTRFGIESNKGPSGGYRLVGRAD